MISLLICFIFHRTTVHRVFCGEAVNTEIFVLDSVLHFVGPKPNVFRARRFCKYNYIIGCDGAIVRKCLLKFVDDAVRTHIVVNKWVPLEDFF